MHLLCPRLDRSCPRTPKTCGMGGNTSMGFDASHHSIYHPKDGMVPLQFLPNLIPQFGCSVAWVDRTSVYLLCHRFWHMLSMYPHSMCNGWQHIHCMRFFTQQHTPPEDGLVVLQVPPSLVRILGAMCLGWTGSQCIDCLQGLSNLSHIPTIYVEWAATYQLHVVLRVRTHTTLRMVCCSVAWRDGISVYCVRD